MKKNLILLSMLMAMFSSCKKTESPIGGGVSDISLSFSIDGLTTGSKSLNSGDNSLFYDVPGTDNNRFSFELYTNLQLENIPITGLITGHEAAITVTGAGLSRRITITGVPDEARTVKLIVYGDGQEGLSHDVNSRQGALAGKKIRLVNTLVTNNGKISDDRQGVDGQIKVSSEMARFQIIGSMLHDPAGAADEGNRPAPLTTTNTLHGKEIGRVKLIAVYLNNVKQTRDATTLKYTEEINSAGASTGNWYADYHNTGATKNNLCTQHVSRHGAEHNVTGYPYTGNDIIKDIGWGLHDKLSGVFGFQSFPFNDNTPNYTYGVTTLNYVSFNFFPQSGTAINERPQLVFRVAYDNKDESAVTGGKKFIDGYIVVSSFKEPGIAGAPITEFKRGFIYSFNLAHFFDGVLRDNIHKLTTNPSTMVLTTPISVSVEPWINGGNGGATIN